MPKNKDLTLVERLNEMPVSESLKIVETLRSEDIEANYADLKLYRKRVVSLLNALSDALMDSVHMEANGDSRDILYQEQQDPKIKYNPDFMAIDPNSIILNEPYLVNADHYLEILCEKRGITLRELKTKLKSGPQVGRRRKIADAYREACYTLRTRFEFSYTEIARILGREDHTSIINAFRKVQGKLERSLKEE